MCIRDRYILFKIESQIFATAKKQDRFPVTNNDRLIGHDISFFQQRFETKEAKNFSVSIELHGIMVVNGDIVTLFFEKEKINMKRILTTYPVISTLALICLLLGLLTSFYGDAMYDLLAFHSKPVYGWQYVSGTLMHGSKGAPIWFLWVHLILNGLMILPFGGLLERKRGSRQVLIVFMTATVLSSIVFHLLTQEQDIQATGISAVGYAFVTGGVMILPNVWKEFSRTVKWFYLFLIFLSGLMLLPVITGWISTLLHLSGIVSYLLVFIGSTILKGRS